MKLLYEVKGFSGPIFNKIRIEEKNFSQIKDMVNETLSNIADMKSIALDMTPGRKYMSAILFQQVISQNSNKIKRIYYQNLEDLSFQFDYYCMTPIAIQSLHNLLDLEHSETQFKKVNLLSNNNPTIDIIYRQELITILNCIYQVTNKDLNIFVNMYELNLFQFEFLNSEIKLTKIISKDDFNKKRKLILSKNSSKEFENELPTYNDVLDAFLMAGIFSKEQEKVFTEIMYEAESFISKPKSYTIALDTNSLIFNFPNGLKQPLEKKNKERLFKNLPLIPIGYFIPPRVKDELYNQSNRKLTNEIIKIFESDLKILNIFNQSTLKARKFQLGSEVLNRIRNYEIYSDNIQSSRKGLNDSAIVEEIATYEKYNNSMMKLISNDDGLVRSAKTAGIDSVRIDKHYKLEDEYFISWNKFIDLIYYLSIIFIDVTIESGEPVKIKGIWSGKNSTNWENQQVKIVTNSKNLHVQLYEYLTPIRKFNENQ